MLKICPILLRSTGKILLHSLVFYHDEVQLLPRNRNGHFFKKKLMTKCLKCLQKILYFFAVYKELHFPQLLAQHHNPLRAAKKLAVAADKFKKS